MIQEIVSLRRTIPDWTPERWSEFMHNVGAVPCWVIYSHVDLWHWILYGAEVLRKHPEAVSSGMKELQYSFKKNHPDYDPTKWQEKIDGKLWGGVPEDDPQSGRLLPVREQIETAQKDLIESNRERSQAVPMERELNLMGPANAYEAKWIQAEAEARRPRAEWEGKHDFEFEQMIKYCYGWLRDIGEVPQPYPMGTIDLFWQRPRPGEVPMDEKTVYRRNYITARVLKFWYKSLKTENNKDKMLFTNPLSYRVVLAAKRLSKYIEMYAVNWQTDEEGQHDEAIQQKVRKAAVEYFNAHFPLPDAGPKATQDPDYPEYIRLCRQYKIKEGTLLHDLEL